VNDQALPSHFVETVLALHGQRGKVWLRDLPLLLERCARRWDLSEIDPPFHLSYNYVAPAVRADGAEVVLKLGIPHPELLTEIDALRHYGGRGSVRLLDFDREEGILLLERLRPGRMLLELAERDDEAATAIAAGVMERLWRPAPEEHAFPTVERWARGLERLRAHFDGGTGPFPAALVERAEALFAELLASQGEQVLLHGDLHHYNILSAERQPWLAIDPKGVVGERAYETGALLRNPFSLIERPDLQAITLRRVTQLAERLELDRARIAGWGFAQSVLSAWWLFEDLGQGWGKWLRLSEILVDLA
jgi:streptomycin 6-kinase